MTLNAIHGPRRTNPFERKTLGEFFFEYLSKYENRVCQVDVLTSQSETYGSLKQRAVRLAVHFRQWGINKNNVILLCSTNSLDCTVALIATFLSGAILAQLDPMLVQRQIVHYVAEVAPKIIFVAKEALETIELSVAESLIHTRIVVYGETDNYDDFAELMQSETSLEKSFVPATVSVEDVAMIVFSLRVPGEPKSICHSHRNFLEMINQNCTSGFDYSRLLSVVSFQKQEALVNFMATLYVGGTRFFNNFPEAEQILQAIEKFQIRSMYLGPFQVLKLVAFTNAEAYPCNSLRHLAANQHTLTDSHFKKLAQFFQHTVIMRMNCLMEVGGISWFNPQTDSYFIKTKPTSCGLLGPNLTAKVVDVNDECDLGPHQKGMLCVKGAALFYGLYKAPRRVGFDTEGYFKTDQIVYYDTEKCFYLVDRVQEIFSYKGWKVLPCLLEDILESHEEIIEAVVFGTYTQNEEDGLAPTACVVREENSALDIRQVQKYLARKVDEVRERLDGGVYFWKEEGLKSLSRKEVRNKCVNQEQQNRASSSS